MQVQCDRVLKTGANLPHYTCWGMGCLQFCYPTVCCHPSSALSQAVLDYFPSQRRPVRVLISMRVL